MFHGRVGSRARRRRRGNRPFLHNRKATKMMRKNVIAIAEAIEKRESGFVDAWLPLPGCTVRIEKRVVREISARQFLLQVATCQLRTVLTNKRMADITE